MFRLRFRFDILAVIEEQAGMALGAEYIDGFSVQVLRVRIA